MQFKLHIHLWKYSNSSDTEIITRTEAHPLMYNVYTTKQVYDIRECRCGKKELSSKLVNLGFWNFRLGRYCIWKKVNPTESEKICFNRNKKIKKLGI